MAEPVSIVLLPLGGSNAAAARQEEGRCGEMIAGPLNPEAINGRELSAADYSGAGLVSGICTRALIQPLDVLKIRFQLQEEPIRGDKRGKYTSIVQSVRTVFREEGSSAFWKGHVPAQGLSAVYGLVQFTTFEMLRKKMSRLSEVSPYKKSIDFACGAVAGCTAMTAAMPMDVLRTRLVAQGKHKVYRSATHAIGVIWRTEKVPGFFRGIVPSLAQIAPYTGLQFTCYNFLSRLWTKYVNELESSGAFVCGALAGTFAKTLLYPLDLVRHRLQVNANIRRGFGKTSHYKGMIRTILRIARREGFLGLYKGLAPSLIKAAANSGFSFLFYELTCDLIRSLKKAN